MTIQPANGTSTTCCYLYWPFDGRGSIGCGKTEPCGHCFLLVTNAQKEMDDPELDTLILVVDVDG
jgi:hypothetical protein